jgi:hypothetical protein
MGAVRLKNVNPLGVVEVPLLGRTLQPGEVFEVDEETAGRKPSDWRPVEEGEQTPRHLTRVRIDDKGVQVLEVYDPGTGLLSQATNFAPATKAEQDAWKKAQSKDDDSDDGQEQEPPVVVPPGTPQVDPS